MSVDVPKGVPDRCNRYARSVQGLYTQHKLIFNYQIHQISLKSLSHVLHIFEDQLSLTLFKQSSFFKFRSLLCPRHFTNHAESNFSLWCLGLPLR